MYNIKLKAIKSIINHMSLINNEKLIRIYIQNSIALNKHSIR